MTHDRTERALLVKESLSCHKASGSWMMVFKKHSHNKLQGLKYQRISLFVWPWFCLFCKHVYCNSWSLWHILCNCKSKPELASYKHQIWYVIYPETQGSSTMCPSSGTEQLRYIIGLPVAGSDFATVFEFVLECDITKIVFSIIFNCKNCELGPRLLNNTRWFTIQPPEPFRLIDTAESCAQYSSGETRFDLLGYRFGLGRDAQDWEHYHTYDFQLY